MAEMNPELIEKIRTCPNLPTLPAIAMQVLELAQKENVDITEIARIISKDPALSGKILKTVNSSFYGRSQNVSTVSHALVILGLQSVKTLVLGFSLVSNLSKSKASGFKHLVYWKRSIYAATAARTFAGKIKLLQQEEAFLATLLMDIGMLVLDLVLGAEYGELCEKATDHEHLARLEMEALGMTHADVGGILAEQWKLPPLLCTPITFHHNAEGATDPALRALTDLVWTAGRVADVFVNQEPAAAILVVREACQRNWKMPEADADAILAEIGLRTKEVASLFEINIGKQISYDQILKQANEALVNLTLQSQMQTTQLMEQNQQLKHAASTDGLTGMANRAAFDAFLAEQFALAVKNQKPLTLLMMDVDKFKSVNDKYGHPTGDVVLRTVSAMVKSAARKQDLAARYGGEEMALVLPDTPRLVAASVAETLRRAIMSRPIVAGPHQLTVTISIGVACYEPPASPLKAPAHLVKAADLAVYAAKHGGRNCVKIFALKAAA